MEILEVRQFADIYRGKRVLVTGHTGFKGSWLTLWLHELGAEVTGVSLSPDTQPNHWNLLQLPIDDHRLDIRDINALKQVIKEKPPEIVFHLAAQPLVRRSYRDPLETWSTNVMGTVNILEACRQTSEVRAIVAITTDKCYENHEWPWGYRENDRLGGHDPYSASKAGAELVAASYRSAFFNTENALLLATARAGNVIGGGDWSEDRLIPDLIRALEMQKSLEIRSPHATRPWQHVLESLSGYLMLGQKLLVGDKNFAEAWNFGPDPEGKRTVSEILGKLNLLWENMRWHITERSQPHETTLLYLDSAKARSRLHWQPVWNIDVTLEKTADWYRAWLQSGQIISRQQLADYVSTAARGDCVWAKP
ncbi:MAG: CDP-glucose 4,6-dehydratase [Magnetococcales bacterium]|nr:CDP-glucose 4,6-dehydratase [Magnetococcales bacterium]